MSPLQPVSSDGRPTPLIIDTDPGLGFPFADVDDNLAILFALASHRLDVRLISIVGGNTRVAEGVASVSQTLSRLRRRVPIAVGAEAGRSPERRASAGQTGGRPAEGLFVSGRERMARSFAGRVHLPPLAATTQAAEPLRPAEAGLAPGEAGEKLPNALTAQIELLERAPEPVTLLCLGPLTNVARLVSERPDLVDRIERLVIMGGAIDRAGNVTPEAEFNIWVDPDAASVVFATAVPKVLIGLDVTMTVSLSLDEIEAALPGSGGIERYLVEGVAAWASIWEQLSGRASFVPHDPIAAAYLVDSSLFTAEPMSVSVEATSGRTVGTRSSKGDTLVCTGVDAANFKSVFLSALACVGSAGPSAERGPSLELFDGERLLFSSDGRWLHPLFELERFFAETAIEPIGLLVRDRIVGKAAALLIARLGIRRVHALTLSRLGERALAVRGIDYSYGTLVDRIDCATEELLLRVEDEETAYRIVADRAKRSASRPTPP